MGVNNSPDILLEKTNEMFQGFGLRVEVELKNSSRNGRRKVSSHNRVRVHNIFKSEHLLQSVLSKIYWGSAANLSICYRESICYTIVIVYSI